MSLSETAPETQNAVEGSNAELRVRQLLALNKAAISITSELEVDALLGRIVDAARSLVGCKYSALGVLGEDGYIERFPTSGVSETEREKIGAPPRGHGLLGVMLRAGHTLRVPDMSKDPRRVGFPPNHPPMTSLLGVPIFVQGKLVGDLYLTDKIDSIDFTEEDEWLVQLLATHAATALTNAQLHAENLQALGEAGRERERWQALFGVTTAINRSVHMDEVVSLVMQSAMKLTGASGAAVRLFDLASDPATDGWHVVSARYSKGLGEQTSDGTLPSVKSTTGNEDARETGQAEGAEPEMERELAGTLVIEDVPGKMGEDLPRLSDGRAVKSLVTVPLRAGGRVVGSLSVYSDRSQAFNVDAVQLQEAFGAVASAAIRNATVYSEAEQGRQAAENEGQRLRELEQMKDEFLSTAAHELRTPLTTIRMAAGLAEEQLQIASQLDGASDFIDPRVIDLLKLVHDGSTRMHSLVNDLLDLTRLEQGRSNLVIENLDMRDVVSASVTATRPLFESKSQTLSMRLPEALCTIHGDKQRLEQVVINLLSNAHKYSPEGSTVEIRVVRSGNECLVRVRDQGSGVPENEREEIFKRFVRSSLHRQDSTASTGLGLPIARTIAEMHNGRVWTEPAPDKGSIFVLSLPLAD